MRTVSTDLFGVSCDPTEKVDCVASTADNAVTTGVCSPDLFVCKNLHIVMSIFGFNKVYLTDSACINYLLCLSKCGSEAADLTAHKARLASCLCLCNSAEILVIECEGLFAENVYSCVKESLSKLSVLHIRNCDYNDVETYVKHIVVVPEPFFLRNFVFRTVLLNSAGKIVANSSDLVSVSNESVKVSESELKTNDTGYDFSVFHVKRPP